MICRNKFVTLLTILFLMILFPVCSTYAVQSGNIEYNAAAQLFDYSKLDITPVLEEADYYFDIAMQLEEPQEKDRFINLAMGKYYLASKINPDDERIYVQIARIYDELKKDSLAKSNFFHATNLVANDPYANFWFGEYYFKRRDFKRALKHYTIAYNNGYANNYDLNFRLATIYEKFADLMNAKKFYEATYSLKPEDTELQEKIQSINDMGYDKSEYYHLIRE